VGTVSENGVRVEVDRVADVAYIRFSNEDVARSVELDDSVLIDLDRFDMAIGIEVLDLDADIPFQRLTNEFHVRSTQVELLRLLRPNISSVVNRGNATADRSQDHSQLGVSAEHC
jgi:uncharacterized protein YuzE